ncbi:hypothetical protein ACLB2K_029791 [Fragaria x ananassa]
MTRLCELTLQLSLLTIATAPVMSLALCMVLMMFGAEKPRAHRNQFWKVWLSQNLGLEIRESGRAAEVGLGFQEEYL